MNTYTPDQHLPALRSLFRKNLLANLGAMAAAVLAFGLFFGFDHDLHTPLSMGISIGLSAVASVTEFFIERALHKRGRSTAWVYFFFFLLPLLILLAMSRSGLFPAESISGILFAVCFIFFRPLISVVILLMDSRRLREGAPLEAVGRMKPYSHRDGDAPGLDTSLLFEDELTHATLMLHTREMSPDHRYRVWYLPRTGLAVSQPIPDDAEVDPFGNLIQPDANPFISDSPETNSFTPTEPEQEPTRSPSASHDPNSPERRRAAKLALWSRACTFLSYGLIGFAFLSAVIFKTTDQAPVFFVMVFPAAGLMVLSNHLKNRGLKLRCTVQATAHCVDTVRRRSGKHSHYYPIVEFEVNGVPYTAELSTTCSPNAVGEPYTVYYDPLDPKTVIGRAGIL